MTTASALVTQAYRDGNLVGTKGVLTPEQITEGLELLNSFIENLIGFDLGEFNFDWPVPPSTTSPVAARFPLLPQGTELPADVYPYPPSNVQLLLTLVADTTIFLPQEPQDGARILVVNLDATSTFSLTIDGNGRLVQGAATITELATDLDQRHLLYRADLGGWQLITTLVGADESPLPRQFDRLLSLGTLDYLLPRYGKDMRQSQQILMRKLMKRLQAQYEQNVPQPSAKPQPFFLPSADRQRHGFGDGTSNGGLF